MPYTPEELAAAYDEYAKTASTPEQQATAYTPEELAAAYDSYQPQPSNVDTLLGAGDSPLIQNARLATGGLSKIVPFGLGDEIIAGGAAASEMLPGFLGGTGASFGDAYDKNLGEIRGYQQAAHETAPIASLGVDIASGAALPVGPALQGATTLGRIGKTALLGGELEGAYNFGNAEGTENRFKQGALGLALGAVGGGALGVVGEGIGKIGGFFGKFSQKAAPLAPEEQAIADLGIGKGALAKAEKYSPSGPMDEPNLVDSVAVAKQNGVFSQNAAENTPNLLQARNRQVIDTASAEATSILDAAGAAQKDVVIPTFTEAQKFLTEHPYDAGLKEEFSRLISEINKNSDGTIGSLYKVKQALQNKGYTGTASSNEKVLARVMQYDLNKQIQNTASELLGPGAGEQLAQLGRLQQQHLSIIPTLQNSKNVAAAEALKEGGDFGLRSAIGDIASEELNQPGVRGAISSSAQGVANTLNFAKNTTGPVMASTAAATSDLANMTGMQPQPKKMPRDWSAVKNDSMAKLAIAIKTGVPPQTFNILPEPAQIELHKQVVTNDPFNAEPGPNNYNIINGEWVNPLEKDFAFKEALNKSPSERALIISQGWQNKAVVNPTPSAIAPAQPAPSFDLADVSASLDFDPAEAKPPSTSPEMDGMISQLERVTNIHNQDRIH